MKAKKERAQEQARQEAGALYQAGDTKGALSRLLMGGDLQGANTYSGLDNNAWTRQHTESRDKTADQHWSSDYALRQSANARAGDKTPSGFEANPTGGYRPIAGGPADPDYLAKTAEVQASAMKPVPIETIGGTKFLVDPSQMGQPQAPGAVPGSPVAQAGQPLPTPPQSSAPDLEAVDEKTGRREGYLKTLDPAAQDYIKKIADYEIDPRTTSVKGGHRERVLSAVAKYDPTYNQNDFGARAKSIKDFSTGPQGNIIRSFDVAIDHLDTLQKAADAMQNGDTRLINQIRNKWRQETGSDLPTNFQALVPLVSGEIAKAVIGSNNALSDREELRLNLKNANSPSQISGVITGYKGLMSGQLKGLKQQYEATTGKKDFDSKLREHTLKELSGGAKSSPVTIDGYTIKEN
jgi:hypothetical protein